jgi:hypothetical protein
MTYRGRGKRIRPSLSVSGQITCLDGMFFVFVFLMLADGFLSKVVEGPKKNEGKEKSKKQKKHAILCHLSC